MLSLFATIALTCISVTRADVLPNFPAGDVQTAGKTCHIAWAGDKNSTTAWKDMSIEFMTGDNFNMVHLTTVTTGHDGTVDGSFDWTCPDVTPNAAVYFYQFRSPHTSTYEWTTRFPIASSSGQVTSPPNSTQPDGRPIPWGKGALANSMTAAPPLVFTTTSMITTTLTTSATSERPPAASATPSNVTPEIVSGCSSFFTETSPFCNHIPGMFNITEPLNCNFSQRDVTVGLAHCLASPNTITADTATSATTTTSLPSAVLPTNVASNVILGCTKFFTRTTELCAEFIAKYGITLVQFESWNGGAGVCDVLEYGKAYCISGR